MSSDFSLHWKRSTNAPVKFKGRGHVAVTGKLVYFHQLYTMDKKIHQFNMDTERWSTLPNPPINLGFTIVAINNADLTTIGSCGDEQGRLYTYNSRKEKWVQKFPPIGSMVFEPFAASTHDKVLVFGRCLVETTMIGLVLDLNTLEWSRFNPFGWFSPNIYHSAVMFVKEDTIYHFGGFDFWGASDLFYACPVNEIQDHRAWEKKSRQPCYYQTIVGASNHILALGGRAGHLNLDKNPEKLKDIYRYDEDSGSWVVFGEMEVARCECMVAVVGNKMIVVGDDDSGEQTSITDIATIV